MPDFTARVTEILREHRWRKYEDRCRCDDPGAYDEHPAHLATLIADAVAMSIDIDRIAAIITDVHVSVLDGEITTWIILGSRAYPFRSAGDAFLWMSGRGKSSGSANDRFETLRTNPDCAWDDKPAYLSDWMRRR